ncbi:hypothetical protein GQ600_25718 [Phytophthora cactorum]|nr:hypothetical protein GQ600_25718 [Phytophthora cactorum]
MARLRKAVFAEVSRLLPEKVIAADLTVFANRAAYAAKEALEEDSPIGSLGGSKTDALIVQVPNVNEADVQQEKLLNLLEWKVPKRLCTSTGQDWPYQGAAELGTSLADPLVQHYNSWQHGIQDKQTHALFLVLSGPGTGNSRMLDEMKGLLCKAAEQSGEHELISSLKKAYEFRVTFENGTSALGSLLDEKNPELDVSFRILYQLAKERKPWMGFVDQLQGSYPSLRLRIEAVINIVVKLEKIEDVKDMTVILCVDGLQKIVNDGTKTCDFYCVLTAICSFLNSSRAFTVCVCSATVHEPVREALADSTQQRVFLLPPPLRGHKFLATRTRIEKQLVDDMGGHGRALEALQQVLHRYHKDSLDEVDEEGDPSTIVDDVYHALKRQYGDVFDSRLFDDPTNCQEVLAAVLSRRRYGVLQRIGLPKKLGEVDNFDKHITRSVLVWQRFEQFVAFYRRVKSIAFCEIPVTLSEFHAAARFGAIDGILIQEPHRRAVVESINQHDTKSVSEDSTCFTNRVDDVKLSEMKTIVINGASASAGDLFMRVRLIIGNKQVQCNEVIQCELLQTKQKMNKATYEKEQAKGMKGNSDVFLLITSAKLLEHFALPPRCGIVSKDEFVQYFGPFASRTYRSLLEPPNINTASYLE